MGIEPDESRLQFYGRRRGRPLRKRKAGLLETKLPDLEVRLPANGCLAPATLFPLPFDDLWLEVGFGHGEHLAAAAAANPSTGFLGCEPFLNGIANLLQLVEDKGLRNVRIFPDDARLLMDALPDACLGRAYILFPDPWPKVRHWNRRIINPDNLNRLSRLLRSGAELRLASDHMGMVRWMLWQVRRHPGFTWLARHPADWRQRPADWPESRYERKALAGNQPVFLQFRKI